MHDFTYHAASSVADAAARAAAGEDAVLMAGGMTLLPTLKQRLAQPSDVIDLAAVAGLRGIEVAGGAVTVGAMTTHDAVANSSGVAAAIPALAAVAGHIGDPQVRNRGTIGGSIANNDPAADYPAALVGLGAAVCTDRREIPADDFFTGLFETALEKGEIVTAVRFPAPEAATYVKFPNPASRYAIVGVFVARMTGGGVRVAVTGAASCVYRETAMEAALEGDFSPSALDGMTASAADLNEDIHASAEYRAHLVGVMARRAVAACR